MNNRTSKSQTSRNPGDNGQSANVIECWHLVKTFTENEIAVEVLKDVSLAVSEGEQLAIMGASGSGKSTLLHILGGLEVATHGSVEIKGCDIQGMGHAGRARLRNRYLGFVYQLHHLLPEFSALENVCMPLLIRGAVPERAGEQARSMLEKVGLGARLHHKPSALSGGERQRAAVARALVSNPACVLADEPTGNLDHKTAQQVYELILELNRELGTSFIVVTHDRELASRMDRILHLEDGVLSTRPV